MATVAIVLRKDKKNKRGEAPIHFRIIKNRQISYISSGLMIAPSQWDEKKYKVKSNHKNSGRLNSFISNKFTEIQDTVLESETISKSLTSRRLRDKVFGKKPSDFFVFADNVVNKYKQEGKIGTYHKNQSIIAKLKDYRPTTSLSFYDITIGFLQQYEQYLRQTLKNGTNTINKDLKFIRKIFNDAIREDVIEYEATPFRKYKIKSEKTQRIHLTEAELTAFERCPTTPGTKLELHRDMFVFASCTGGLRVSDMLQLQWKDFDGTHLNIVIKKTGTQVSIKVPNKGLAILEKYRPVISCKGPFIFRMLPEAIDTNDPEAVDNAISSATAYINKNLKIIAGKVGIEKKCSFHISRHSFAVTALRKGISIDKLSKLMAHSAIRETQIYAKVVNEELDKAMDTFNL